MKDRYVGLITVEVGNDKDTCLIESKKNKGSETFLAKVFIAINNIASSFSEGKPTKINLSYSGDLENKIQKILTEYFKNPNQEILTFVGKYLKNTIFIEEGDDE